MAVLDRYLGELEAESAKIAVESLENPGTCDAFAFGKAVGRLEGLKLAKQALERVLSESEVDERGSGRNRSKA